MTDNRKVSAEQQARDLLERCGVEDAQSFSAGDVVELANLIAKVHELEAVRHEAYADGYTDAVRYQAQLERDKPEGDMMARVSQSIWQEYVASVGASLPAGLADRMAQAAIAALARQEQP